MHIYLFSPCEYILRLAERVESSAKGFPTLHTLWFPVEEDTNSQLGSEQWSQVRICKMMELNEQFPDFLFTSLMYFLKYF